MDFYLWPQVQQIYNSILEINNFLSIDGGLNEIFIMGIKGPLQAESSLMPFQNCSQMTQINSIFLG